MKKLFFALLLVSLTISGFSQSIPKAQTDYLKKSKHQKTTAWFLLGGGAVSATIGGIMNAHEVFDPNSWERKFSTKGTPLLIIGDLSMAASIPLFIMASKNKKKALSLSIKNEAYPQIYKRSFVYNNIPSLSIKFNF